MAEIPVSSPSLSGVHFGTAARMHHRRIAVLLVLALSVATVIAGYLIVRSEASRRDGIAQRFDARQSTAARFIEAYLNQTLAEQVHLATLTLTGSVSQQRFGQILRENGFSTGILLDAQGRRLRVSPASPIEVGADLDTADPALKAALAGSASVRDIIPPDGQPPVIGLVVPFTAPTGQRVFAGGYPLSGTPLNPFLADALTAYHTAHVYLIDANGTVLSTDRGEKVGQSLKSVSAPLAAAMLTQPDGFFGHQAQREHYIAGPIQGTPWRLVFTLQAKELFIPFTPAQRWTPWGALVGFVLMGLGMITLFTRALAGRVKAEDDHSRQEAILETTSDAFIGMDDGGLVVEWNTAAARLLGWSRAEATGQSVATLIANPRDRDAHSNGVRAFLETGIPRLPKHPITLAAMHRDGHEIPVELTVSRTHWQGSWRFHAFMRDITERVEYDKQLREMALTDPLTGLANRRAFLDNLDQAHARARRHGSRLAVLYADVDQFKSINDTYGHAAGDAILTQIAERLREHFRTEDTIGRLGGDEFAIVCEDFTSHSETLVERLRTVLAVPYSFRGQPILGTVSVGLASPEDDESTEHLLERADRTMYRAKARTHHP